MQHYDEIDQPVASSLVCLPSDVLITVFHFLPVGALHRVSLTCRYLKDLVSQFGWASYLRSNPRHSWSLSCIDQIRSPYEHVRHNTISDANWKKQNFVARPLSAPWRGKLHPKLAISRSRLVVAAGCNLSVYAFSQASHVSDDPVVRLEGTYSVNRADMHHQVHHDITAIAFLSRDCEDRILIAGFSDGLIMRVTLPDVKKCRSLLWSDSEPLSIGIDSIQSISTFGKFSFTLTSLGKGKILDSSGKTTSEINVNEKSWSSFIPSAGAPYVAIGTSSNMPLAIYPMHEAALSSVPSAALTSIKASEWTSRIPASAVYGITAPPPSFPGSPGQIIVSGWFDGRVRLYDLRTPPTSATITASSTKTTRLLSPVMSMIDPWATESIYSVSSGGGSGYTIAAGTARHSVVAFWDVRVPREGWSVHAPGNDTSPVYAVELEASRLFGVTDSRAFVCDFGPGVNAETYPTLPPPTTMGRRNRRGLDNSLRTNDGVRFAVTKYLHRDPLAGG